MTQKDILIKSLQEEVEGLIINCQKWADKVHRLEKAGDAMAETCWSLRMIKGWRKAKKQS